MRYAVRYFRDPAPGSEGPSIPTFFAIAKLRGTPSVGRVWSLVREHAARYDWVVRGDEEAVRVLEGEVDGARELRHMKVPDVPDAVVCMKMREV